MKKKIKNGIKRFLALTLAVGTTLTALPTTSFASEITNDTTDSTTTVVESSQENTDSSGYTVTLSGTENGSISFIIEDDTTVTDESAEEATTESETVTEETEEVTSEEAVSVEGATEGITSIISDTVSNALSEDVASDEIVTDETVIEEVEEAITGIVEDATTDTTEVITEETSEVVVESSDVTVVESSGESSSVRTYEAGESVKVLVSANEGYTVESFSASQEDGSLLDYVSSEDGTYYFSMPESNVTVTVTFTEKVTYVEFDHYFSEIDESLVTTSDLIVTTSNPSIFTKNTNVVSNYDNAYIISCDSVEQARYIYSYYVGKVGTISDMSQVVTISTDDNAEDVADLSDINNSSDVLSTLNDAVEATTDYSGYIALIDTGADADVNFSVIGDDTADNNGHGTTMLNLIKENNPDAKVMSIKVSEGSTTDVASIYAGIMLAIESNVSEINLSMVGYDTESSAIVKEAIQQAISAGIVVIGAAGNYSTSATKFIPGNVDGVIVVGAVNEDGTLYETSNYDADVYVVATSTSEATAIYTGLYTAGVFDDTRIYTTYLDEAAEESDNTTYVDINQLLENLSGDDYYLTYSINDDGTITINYIPTITAFETAYDSDAANCIYSGQGASYSTISNYSTETGTCNFTKTGAGYGYATNFSGTLGTILSSIGISSVSFCCDRHWDDATDSQGAKALDSSSAMYYQATVTSTSSTDMTYSITFDILLSSDGNFGPRSWSLTSRAYRWSYSVDYMGGSLWEATASINGVTIFDQEYDEPTVDADLIVSAITEYLEEYISEQIDDIAKANANTYAGVRGLYSSGSWPDGSSESGSGTVTYYWYATNQSQVYRARVTATATKGYLVLQKSSSNTTITNGNRLYSLTGATYGVYSNSACTSLVGTVTIQSNGDSTALAVWPGVYYVKELSAPTGYILDQTVKEVNVTKDNGQYNYFSVTDTPSTDPIGIILNKESEVDYYTPSLANAYFTVEYYDGYYTTEAEAKSGGNLLKTLTYKTNSDGQLYLRDSSLIVDGTPYTQNGAITFPIGTLVIKETQAPNGYLVNDTVWVVQMTTDTYGNITQTTYADGVPVDVTYIPVGQEANTETKCLELFERGDLSFYKVDVDGKTYANIPFLVSLLDDDGNIVESHVIVTDEYGCVNTATRSKTASSINQLDYYEDGVWTGTDEQLASGSNYNIWFGDSSLVSTGRGSLIYGNYLIQELQCEANEGEDLLEQYLFLDADEVEAKFYEGCTLTSTVVTKSQTFVHSEVYIPYIETIVFYTYNSLGLSTS